VIGARLCARGQTAQLNFAADTILPGAGHKFAYPDFHRPIVSSVIERSDYLSTIETASRRDRFNLEVPYEVLQSEHKKVMITKRYDESRYATNTCLD